MKYTKFFLFVLLAIAFACNEKPQSDNTSENTDMDKVESVVLVDQLLAENETRFLHNQEIYTNRYESPHKHSDRPHQYSGL